MIDSIRLLHRSFFLGTCAILVLSTSSFAAISVQTHDGRVITGEVDEQTTDRALWIRQKQGSILLTTSVAWSAIVDAKLNGQSLPLENLHDLLREQVSSEPFGFLLMEEVAQDSSSCQYDCASKRKLHKRRNSTSAKVRSLEIDAFLVNLDHDVEPDGIELAIAAINIHGVPVPVRGSLYVRLVGERIQPHGSLVRYEELQQWNQPVVPIDFTDGIASYAMPFSTVRPEFDVGLHSDALVHLRLGVFGQGNFSASVPVQIRRFEPFRDRLQLTRGTRFVRDEFTEELRHDLPWRTHTRQLRTR